MWQKNTRFSFLHQIKKIKSVWTQNILWQKTNK
jgi:hypothetical protein